MRMKSRYCDCRYGFSKTAFFWLMAILGFALCIPWRAIGAGTWTYVTNQPPQGINTMLLLSDGTVMAAGAGIGNTWYRLTPDSRGNYAGGTWSTLAAMNYNRLYFSSAV